MPVYVHCPHCEHPHVVPFMRRGRATRCRQCGEAYHTSAKADNVLPLAGSIQDVHERVLARRRGVHVIDG